MSRAETRFRLSAKRTSPLKSEGASVQSTTGSRGVRISGSNAAYTMFQSSVKSTGYPLHSPVSPSLPLSASPCAITFQLESNYYMCHLQFAHYASNCVLTLTFQISARTQTHAALFWNLGYKVIFKYWSDHFNDNYIQTFKQNWVHASDILMLAVSAIMLMFLQNALLKKLDLCSFAPRVVIQLHNTNQRKAPF